MRKQVFGRHLQRDTHERKALFKSLMTSLIINESIKTTEAKAKAVKGQIEKFVTKAKKEGVQAERVLQGYFAMPIARKLINEVAPRFTNRQGGYTRIIKLGNRLHDNAKMVILEWVEKKPELVQSEVVNSEEPTAISKKSSREPKAASARSSSEPKEKKTEKKVQVKEDSKEKKTAKKITKKKESK